MKTSKCYLSIACVIALVAIMLALPGRLPGQIAAANSSGGNGTSATQWSVQIDQVDAGNVDLSYSFQIAIYENLLEELNKTKQFQQVFHDGDLKASAKQKRARLQLNPVRYERLRNQVLCRDGWRCQSCGAMSNLEVHHKRFRSQSGYDSEQNLITLCVECHSRVHNRRA